MQLTSKAREEILETYVSEVPDQTPQDQSTNAAQLDTFVGHQVSLLQDRYRRLAAQEKQPIFDYRHSDIKRFCSFRALEWFAISWSKDILKAEINHIQSILAVASVVHDHLSANPRAIASIPRLEASLNEFFQSNPDYLAAKKKALALSIKLELLKHRMPLPPHRNHFTACMLLSVAVYDQEVCYCPPSEFDSMLGQFLLADPSLNPIVRSAAVLIADGHSKVLLSTLGELNKFVRDKLQITTGASSAVLFIGILRQLFHMAYLLNPVSLLGNTAENAEFLVLCHEFSGQTVRDLDLMDAITRHYTPGLPVASMFKSKQIAMLKEMEFMTNPIDMLVHVNQILGKLAGFFASGEGFLSFDDTMTLLLALLSIDPPCNALAIAGFVEKWECVQLSNTVAFSAKYLVAAVNQIQIFHRALADKPPKSPSQSDLLS
jgi:hypothetical protein